MTKFARYDRASVKGDAKLTDEGYIRANAVVTRTGIFQYQNGDGTIRRELRHPDDVWNADSISSMELIPITNGHPQEKLVSAQNAKRLAIGYTGETIKKDGDYLLTNMVITDQEGVDAVIKHGRKELSLGYMVDLEEKEGMYNGEPYDARQRNIRYNHLAIVDKARAGNEARIALDSKDAIELEILTEVLPMAKRKIKIDNEEVMVDESTADYISRLEDDLKNLEEEKARVEREIKMIAAKLERAEGEKDSMRDKLSSMEDKAAIVKMSHDSADFNKAVQERIKLYKVAEKYLDATNLTKLDSMNDLDIKRSIIQQCRKSINLDGKSEIYIDAMFDTILDDKAKLSVKVDNVSFLSKNSAHEDGEDPVRAAQLRMIERQKNAHKISGGK